MAKVYCKRKQSYVCETQDEINIVRLLVLARDWYWLQVALYLDSEFGRTGFDSLSRRNVSCVNEARIWLPYPS